MTTWIEGFVLDRHVVSSRPIGYPTHESYVAQGLLAGLPVLSTNHAEVYARFTGHFCGAPRSCVKSALRRRRAPGAGVGRRGRRPSSLRGTSRRQCTPRPYVQPRRAPRPDGRAQSRESARSVRLPVHNAHELCDGTMGVAGGEQCARVDLDRAKTGAGDQQRRFQRPHQRHRVCGAALVERDLRTNHRGRHVKRLRRAQWQVGGDPDVRRLSPRREAQRI